LRTQKRKPIELRVADFRHRDAETILKPLSHQVPMTEGLTQVAFGRGFPTKHHWPVTNGYKPVVDFGRVEAAQDFIVQLEIPRWGDRPEPGARLERS
jgi:hypothetical protein